MIRFKFEDFELIAGQKSVVFLGKDKDEDLVWREAFNPVDFRKVLAHLNDMKEQHAKAVNDTGFCIADPETGTKQYPPK